MIIVFGEVLFDVFPQYKRIGGAPFNFAFHLRRLGFPVRFVSRIGDDANGREIRRYLEAAGLNGETVQIDPKHPTGYVSVSLNEAGVPEYSIVFDVAYDFIEMTDALEKRLQEPPSLVYFGTLAQRRSTSHQTLQRILAKKHESTYFFYDINLRTGCYTLRTIEDALPYPGILKLNREELTTLRQMFDYKKDETSFINHLMEKYELSLLSLTDGDRGSALITPETRIDTPGVVADNPVDTVGAGDALAAVLSAGFLTGRPLPDTLEAATRFAADICTIPGAVPEKGSFYQDIKAFIDQ